MNHRYNCTVSCCLFFISPILSLVSRISVKNLNLANNLKFKDYVVNYSTGRKTLVEITARKWKVYLSGEHPELSNLLWQWPLSFEYQSYRTTWYQGSRNRMWFSIALRREVGIHFPVPFSIKGTLRDYQPIRRKFSAGTLPGSC